MFTTSQRDMLTMQFNRARVGEIGPELSLPPALRALSQYLRTGAATKPGGSHGFPVDDGITPPNADPQQIKKP
jgi:hypothetical protein